MTAPNASTALFSNLTPAHVSEDQLRRLGELTRAAPAAELDWLLRPLAGCSCCRAAVERRDWMGALSPAEDLGEGSDLELRNGEVPRGEAQLEAGTGNGGRPPIVAKQPVEKVLAQVSMREAVKAADLAFDSDAAHRDSTAAALAKVSGQLGLWRRRAQRQSAEAPAAAARLLSLDADRWAEAIAREVSFQSPVLARVLSQVSRVVADADGERGRHVAAAAVVVAEALDSREYTRGVVADARAAALAALGNARRCLGDLEGSAAAFRDARSCLVDGTAIDLAVAEVEDLEALLLVEQRRFDEALERLERATLAYRDAGSQLQAARTEGLIGRLLTLASRPELAVPRLQRAVAAVDGTRDPHLYSWLSLQLVLALAEAHRAAEARDLLPTVREACHRLEDHRALLALRWAEGRLDAASEAVDEVRRGLLAEGAPYDAALATLDLASLYLEQGRDARARMLASGLHALLEERGLGSEARATLTVFQHSLWAGLATGESVGHLAAYLRSSRLDRRRYENLTGEKLPVQGDPPLGAPEE